MSTKAVHPLDSMREVFQSHTGALQHFKLFQLKAAQAETAPFFQWTVSALAPDHHSFVVTFADQLLLCALSVRQRVDAKALVSFYRLNRFDDKVRDLLGEVAFSTDNGITERRHFSQYEGDVGDQLYVSQPSGARDLVIQHLLKALDSKPT